MVNRGEILWLGIASGVMGCLIGGMMLGIGMDLIVNGQPWGWLLLLPAAVVGASLAGCTSSSSSHGASAALSSTKGAKANSFSASECVGAGP